MPDHKVRKVTKETKVTKEIKGTKGTKETKEIPGVVVDYPIPVLQCKEPST